MSFTTDLQKFRKDTARKYTSVMRVSAFDLFSSIILDTPVDKGVLRNNWFAAISNGSAEITKIEDPSGQATISKIQSVLTGTDLAKPIFFTNNLPYALPIEFDGISGKAPEGMVRVNTLRWDKIVSANVRKANRRGG